jgi:hypothetical protein
MYLISRVLLVIGPKNQFAPANGSVNICGPVDSLGNLQGDCIIGTLVKFHLILIVTSFAAGVMLGKLLHR